MTPLRQMMELARHRGPDGEGAVVGDLEAVTSEDARGNWALGHVRLAILDLSKAGLQPMGSVDGRVWIAFNGEVYNYVELAAELTRLGHSFRTGTDTEVILAAYRQWGTACVKRFRGMFAWLLVDLDRATVWAARDRLGIKPLYFWNHDDLTVVVSELKQLYALPEFVPQLNRQLVCDYLCEGLLGHEIFQTFFEHVVPLGPGHSIQWPLGQPADLTQQHSYWEPARQTVSTTWDQAVARTEDVFCDAVKLRLRSDVAVGTCLSGGIDSSSIVGVAARDFDVHMKTFSVCHNDPRISEEHYIDEVVDYCGADSIKLRLNPEDALRDLDDFLYMQDEPVYSLSQYGEYAVMRLARQHDVVVLLNGQGGDESLCGYRKFVYFYLQQLLREHHYSRAFAHVLNTLRYGDRQLFQFWQGVRYIPGWMKRRYDPMAEILLPEWQALRRSAWRDRMSGLSNLHEHQWADLRHWSLPVLLRYQDRNSMAHGVEARVPMVDHEFVESALTMPEAFFFHQGMTKRLLVEGLENRLPHTLRTRRTKLGFDTPQAAWMRGDLGVELEHRVQCCDRLDTLIDRRAASQAFQRYRQGDKTIPHFALFRIACLAIWLERFQVEVGAN